VLDIDVTISLETTWHAMEELVSAGLTKSIGDVLRDSFAILVAVEFAAIMTSS
jgi:aldehyde reductase